MKRIFQKNWARLRSVPLLVYIGGGAVLLSVAYIWTFIIPTNIQFSYANKESCTGWFTLAPDWQKQRAGKQAYLVTPKDTVSLFGAPIFSRSVCVSSVNAPKQGLQKVSFAPFGLPIFSKTFGVHAPAIPSAQMKGLKDAEISAVRPLLVPLSSKDVTHSYTLRQGDKGAECQPVDGGVRCAISQLALEPSTPYELALYRAYKNDEPQKTETLSVRTLTAVQLTDSTVKIDQTIYDKPADFRFTFDRPVEDAKASLARADGGTLKTTITTNENTVVVTPDQPLPRNTKYQLTLEEVTAKDGGSLADPVVTPFTMSGGPKVANVSVGASGVAQNARIIVTFDQPLKADIDLAKLARMTGVSGSVVKASDTSIAFTIANAPLCSAFSLVVDKGLPSGSNDETSAEAWKFDSRIICGSSSIIGYSVRGRAIVAYTFGTGGTTILYSAGIHGNEPSSVTTMQAWVTYLQYNAYKIPADKKVVVVPNMNPDGIATGSRNNVNNVNLARNYPAGNWRPDIDTASGTLPTGGGAAPGSEPETQAGLAITRQLRPRLSVSFHAQGSLVGANQFGDSTAIGTQYAKTVGYASMIGNAEEVMGYSITGEYEQWMGEELGTPAILIELPRLSGNYFQSQLNALLYTLSV